MKIFFTTTPRLKVHYNKNVEKIFKTIESLGHTHTSDYIVKVDVNDFYKFNEEGTPTYYMEILNSLKKADVIVFEASLPSIGVGHLLEKALDLGKGVICLHMKGKIPFFLTGIKDQKLVIEEYTLTALPEVLKNAFNDVLEQMDVRFNFFIPPKIEVYLNWVARERKIPRAVYLRRLIEEDLKKNRDYKEK